MTISIWFCIAFIAISVTTATSTSFTVVVWIISTWHKTPHETNGRPSTSGKYATCHCETKISQKFHSNLRWYSKTINIIIPIIMMIMIARVMTLIILTILIYFLPCSIIFIYPSIDTHVRLIPWENFKVFTTRSMIIQWRTHVWYDHPACWLQSGSMILKKKQTTKAFPTSRKSPALLLEYLQISSCSLLLTRFLRISISYSLRCNRAYYFVDSIFNFYFNVLVCPLILVSEYSHSNVYLIARSKYTM